MKAQKLDCNIEMEIIEIGHEMKVAGLPSAFITSAVKTAFEFEGVYDLLKIWQEEKDPKEKEMTIADIQEMIDECSQKDLEEGVYISFDDLEQISQDVRKFKDSLRMVVDQEGGMNKLSELTGIPQPSLSRFFSSSSIPRRLTLNKIANALGLSQVQILNNYRKNSPSKNSAS